MIKHELIRFLEMSMESRGDEGEEDRKVNLEVWYVVGRLKFANRLKDEDKYIILSELQNFVSEDGDWMVTKGFGVLCITAFRESLEIFPDMEDPRSSVLR